MLRVLGENEKVDHEVMAAGQHRRTDDERKDQYLSWVRSDQAFFAAGACHILAYVTQAAYPAEQISLLRVRPVGSDTVNHVVAGWDEYAFDFSGWHRLGELLAPVPRRSGRARTAEGIPVDIAALWPRSVIAQWRVRLAL